MYLDFALVYMYVIKSTAGCVRKKVIDCTYSLPDLVYHLQDLRAGNRIRIRHREVHQQLGQLFEFRFEFH